MANIKALLEKRRQICYNKAVMNRYSDNKEQAQQKFLIVFKDRGLVSFACREAGFSRASFHRWLDEGNEFAQAFQEAVYDCFLKHKTMWKKIPKDKRNIWIQSAIEMDEEDSELFLALEKEKEEQPKKAGSAFGLVTAV